MCQPDATTLATARDMGATHITYYARHWALERDVWKVYRRLDCLAGNRWHVAFIGYRDNPQWQPAASEPTAAMAIDAPIIQNGVVLMTTSISHSRTGINLHIGPWDNPDKQLLEGFDTAWDAWAFAVAHGLPDPQESISPHFRQWCNRPPAEVEPKEQQLGLFA